MLPSWNVHLRLSMCAAFDASGQIIELKAATDNRNESDVRQSKPPLPDAVLHTLPVVYSTQDLPMTKVALPTGKV